MTNNMKYTFSIASASISCNIVFITRDMITVVNLILSAMDEEKENITNVIKKNTLNMKEIVTKLESIIRLGKWKNKTKYS